MAMSSGEVLTVPEKSCIRVFIGAMLYPLLLATCFTSQTAIKAACSLLITQRCGSAIAMLRPERPLEAPCAPLARQRGLAFVRRPFLAQPPAPWRSLCSPAIVTEGLPAIVTRWCCAYPVAVEVRFQESEPCIDPARDIGVERRTPRILDLRSVHNICP
jgi:hypothetical protein